MSFLDKLRRNNESGPTPQEQAQGSQWGALARVPFQSADQSPNTYPVTAVGAESLPAPDERQQRKIIAGLRYGADFALRSHDIKLSSADRNFVLEGMADGSIGNQEERYFLSCIKDPMHMTSAEQLFDTSFAGHRQADRILAYATGLNPSSQYDQVTPDSLKAFLARYPLPMDFEATSIKFLQGISAHNPPAKYQEYVTSMNAFKHNIYGKRQEYWDQIKLLQEEADKYKAKQPETTIDDEPSAQPQLPERASGPEQREWLSRTQLEGDPWIQGGRQFELTAQALRDYNLGPEYKSKVDNVQVRLSNIFRVGSRDAAIGYIEDDNGVVHARGYYRSNSQGLWRYLPDYVSDGTGEINYYGKGGFDSAEESTTLPWELQRDLSALASEPNARQDNLQSVVNPSFILGGTAAHYPTKESLRYAYAEGTARGAFYREVSSAPSVEFGTLSREKISPDRLSIGGTLAPDFSRSIAKFTMRPPMFGEVQTDCVPSVDDRLNYLFCQDPSGRAWIGSVQNRSHVTSTGCRSEWVSAGDYATPLYEYQVIAGGYGDPSDTRGHYVGMWRNYLSQAPIIQQFLRQSR